MLISDIYNKHPRTILPDVSIQEALRHLLEHEHNGFIVVDKKKCVLGILSLQDIAAAVIPTEFKQNLGMAKAMYRKGFFHESCGELKKKSVEDVMRTTFTTVDLHTNIMAVVADFLENDLYIVPVINHDKLIGVVTRSEVKQALANGMGLT